MGRDTDDELTLAHLQRQVALWAQQNWPDRTDYQNRDLPFYRIVAAVGAIADGGVFDAEADERVDPDVTRDELRLGLGKLVVMIVEFAARNGWSVERVVREAWEEVRGEGWRPYPNIGRPPKDGRDE